MSTFSAAEAGPAAAAAETPSQDSAQAVRSLFADELERHRDELVEAGIQRFVSDLPAYAGLVADEGPTRLRDNLAQHLRSVADIARSPATAKSHHDSTFELSLRRAQQGFPLEDVLRSAQMMNQLLWDWMMTHPAFDGERAEYLRHCWPLWLQYVDAMNSESSRAYVVAAREDAEHDLITRRRFVEQLLTGRTSSFDAQRAAQTLGFEDGVDFRLLMMQFWDEPTHDLVSHHLYDVVGRLRPVQPTSTPAVTLNDAIVVLVQCSERQFPQLQAQVERMMSSVDAAVPVSAGISRSMSRLVEVREHYDELQQVVRVGRSSGASVVLAEQVSLFEHAVSALHSTIGQVCPPDLRAFVRENTKHMTLWLDTMTAYARHRHSVRETAAALHVHPNTVYYRLGQIGEASGRDLTSMTDFTDVWIALTYWQLIHARDLSQHAHA